MQFQGSEWTDERTQALRWRAAKVRWEAAQLRVWSTNVRVHARLARGLRERAARVEPDSSRARRVRVVAEPDSGRVIVGRVAVRGHSAATRTAGERVPVARRIARFPPDERRFAG